MTKAEMIKNLRMRYGMTQVDFAKLVGISERALYTLEKGKSSPSLRTSRKIVELAKEKGLEIELIDIL